MDTVANMLTSLVNAQRVGNERVAVPYSRFNEQLLKLLKEQHGVASVRTQKGNAGKLVISLPTEDSKGKQIRAVRRLSKPGRRLYVTHKDIPYLAGNGFVVISTSSGLREGEQARQERLGGELICEIRW